MSGEGCIWITCGGDRGAAPVDKSHTIICSSYTHHQAHASPTPLFRDHSRRVFAGSQAGPVATLWDDRQLRLYLGGATRPDVSIWSCSGRQMGLILWEHGRVVAGGWTPDETLVLIETDGQVRRERVVPAAGWGEGG